MIIPAKDEFMGQKSNIIDALADAVSGASAALRAARRLGDHGDDARRFQAMALEVLEGAEVRLAQEVAHHNAEIGPLR